jgi:hypothetical protein
MMAAMMNHHSHFECLRIVPIIVKKERQAYLARSNMAN